MKRLVSVAVILLIVIPLVAFAANADGDAPSEEKVRFTYDFSDVDDFKATFGITQDNQVQYTPADGYTTFTATGEDPYFRIGTGGMGDSYCPPQNCSDITFIVMRYRTDAKIAKGEFFTNHGGQTWGMEGTHVEFPLANDGEWHNVIIDATATWGGAVGEPLYAFRIDPLYTGCVSGDTIDIEYVKFFSTYADAYEYATGEVYVEETTGPKTCRIEYYVNDRLMTTIYYAAGEWTSDDEPAVPAIPGKNGMWSYNGTPQHGDELLKAVAVYTDIDPETVVEPDPAVTEKYELATEPQPMDDPALESTVEMQSTPDTSFAETVETTVGEADDGGCGGLIGGTFVLLAFGAGLTAIRRRK